MQVKSSTTRGVERHFVVLTEAGTEVPLNSHLFSLVGRGDTIRVGPTNASRMSVVSTEDPDDLIPVAPHFEARRQFRLGAIDTDILIKELTTPQDLDEYKYLEGFHYKTSSAIVSEDGESDNGQVSAGGRKAVLLAYVQHGKRLLPAGYIELHMPLLMTKPRHELFAHGFSHPTRPVQWDTWDVRNMRGNVNLIVRIARVVVSPDLRGLGLARVLIGAAQAFARERWHIGGRRPLFMEISAEMLKYMDFASSAGLHFVGNTEGNLARVHTDLVHMLRGQKMTHGIMSLQKKYLTALTGLADEMGLPLSDVLERLKELTVADSDTSLIERLNALKPQEWHLYKRVLRFPIPYYICGLDEPAEEFIREHTAPSSQHAATAVRPVRGARIALHDLQVSSKYSIPDSPESRAIKDCFGLNGNLFQMSLVGPVSVEASGGNIILITGPSGCGKSILLSALDPKRATDGLAISYRNACREPYSVEWMTEIESDRPLIEYFSEAWGIEASIAALNQVGLSEAFIYLRPYYLLSRGQQYRARLAKLRLGSAPVWLMDEFCADLDPFSARIVASNLRKHVIRTGRIAVVAAANNAHYIDALRPTRVIYLRHNGRSETFKYREYIDEFHVQAG